MDRITNTIIQLLLKKRIISKQDQELYSYGLKAFMFIFINFLTALLLGYHTNRIMEVIVFFLFFIPLRSYAGGYHTKNKLTCYFFSNFMLLAIIYIPTITSSKTAFYVIGWLFFLSIILILRLAPIPNFNRSFDDIEQKIFMKRTRCILFIELLFIAITFVLHFSYWIKLLMLAPITVALLLILSLISNRILKAVNHMTA